MQKQRAVVKSNGFASVVPKHDAHGLTAQQFAEELFEFEYCGECHGDVVDHDFVIGPFGAWFALCKSEHVKGCRVCN